MTETILNGLFGLVAPFIVGKIRQPGMSGNAAFTLVVIVSLVLAAVARVLGAILEGQPIVVDESLLYGTTGIFTLSQVVYRMFREKLPEKLGKA